MNHPVNKDEFDAWLQHPVTKRFFHLLKQEVEDKKDMWVSGSIAEPEFVRGFIQAYLNVTQITYEGLYE